MAKYIMWDSTNGKLQQISKSRQMIIMNNYLHEFSKHSNTSNTVKLKYRSEAKNQTKCKTAKQDGTIVGGKRGVGSKLKGQS